MGLSGTYGSCQQRQIGFDTNHNECDTPALKFQLKVLEFAVMGRWEKHILYSIHNRRCEQEIQGGYKKC